MLAAVNGPTDRGPDHDPTFHAGDRLRKAREHAGQYALNHFAERIGIHRDTLMRYERTGLKIKAPTFLAYAVATGVRVEWLRYGTGTMHHEPEPHRAKATTSDYRVAKQRAGILQLPVVTVPVRSGRLAA